MAEAIERHYPGRFELCVSDYMEELGISRLDQYHKDSWRRALQRPVLARAGQRAIDLFPRLTMAVERRILRGFARAAASDLKKDPPLLVVSNHGLITAGLAEAQDRYGLGVRVLTFATEPFEISAYWGEPRADRLIVASEDCKRRLARFGVPEDKMTILGRPIRQAFLEAPPQAEARRRLGLDNRFTCLISFGGEGVGKDPRGTIEALLNLDTPVQVVAITGRNPALKEELRKLRTAANGLRVEGFVDNMAEYLSASDVFIGKAGPSSVFEALAIGRPVLATGYAGLNELGVVRFVESEGLGRYVTSPEKLAEEVKRYAREPSRLREVARRCEGLPLISHTEDFAHHIVRYALDSA